MYRIYNCLIRLIIGNRFCPGISVTAIFMPNMTDSQAGEPVSWQTIQPYAIASTESPNLIQPLVFTIFLSVLFYNCLLHFHKGVPSFPLMFFL